MEMEVLQEQVIRGTSRFDVIEPDWYQHVDPDKLNMDNGDQCIIGQLSAHHKFPCPDFDCSWEQWASRLVEDKEPALQTMINHGLYVSKFHTPDDLNYAYATLTRLWRHEVEVRMGRLVPTS